MRKALKYGAFVLAGIAALVAAAAIVSQTDWFKERLGAYIVRAAEGRLDARLAVDRLGGNLFEHIELDGVRLMRGGDTLLAVSSITIDYRPGRLFAREIHVDSCVIDAPRAGLRRRPDGSWNFSSLVRPRPLEAPAEKGAGKKFPFDVRLERVAMRDGALFIDSKEPAVPRAVTDLMMTFSAYWSDSTQTLALTELSLRSAKPPIVLEQLTFSLKRTREELILSDLSLRTARNAVTGGGLYSASAARPSRGNLETGPVDLAGLQTVFPTLKIRAHPAITLDASIARDTLSARIGLEEKSEGLVLDAAVFGLSKVFDTATRDRVGYSLKGAARSLDVARWSGNAKAAIVASGTFELRGKGFTARGASLDGSFDLGNSSIRRIRFADLAGKFSYASEDASAAVDAGGRFGRLKAKASVTALSGDRRFEAAVETRDVDLAALTGRDTLRSRLNAAATARGSNLGRRTMTASVEMRMSSSEIRRLEIDTVFADVEYGAERVLIRRLEGRTAAGTFEASGSLGRGQQSALSFALGLADLGALRAVVPADTLRGSGRIEGVVTGAPDSISAKGRFSFSRIAYNAMRADSIGGDFEVHRRQSRISGGGSVELLHPGSGGLAFESISVELGYSDNSFNQGRPHPVPLSNDAADTIAALACVADVVYRDSIAAHAEAEVSLGAEPVVAVRDIRLDLRGRTWAGGSPETMIRLGKDGIRFEHLSLAAPERGKVGTGSFSLDGTFSRIGEEDLRVKVANLDLRAIMKLLRPSMTVEGALSVEAELTGTAREPRLAGKVEAADLLYPPFKCKGVSSDFRYGERRFTVSGFIESVKGPRVTIDGFIPCALSLDGSGEGLLMNEPWELAVKGATVPVGSFAASTAAKPPATGLIDLDVRASNTMARPEFTGSCAVREGAFAVPALGIDCRRFVLGLSLNKETVSIDSLRADIGDGFISASGFASFGGRSISGRLTGVRLELAARNLYLERRRKFEILFAGGLKVEGTDKESKIDGKFTIERSRFFLSALTARGAAGGGEAAPLLVASLKQSGRDTTKAAARAKVASSEPRLAALGFVKGMEGSVRISIPSGTWLRSPEINIEIGGELDVVKNGTRLELFGPIQILRGQFTLYGKRFQITKGTLTFKGGEEINPDISVSADCEFRTTDGNKKTVTAVVTGVARGPSVRFTLDGKDITETDAISYITMGTSAQELATSGGASSSSTGSSGTDLAASAAAGMLASQLSYALGGTTSLDVLDIDTQNSWQNATVTVGKYLSPKLFVSYQAGIGQFDQDEIDPNAVTLEYQVSRLFHLQLVAGDSENSGLGFLLKYER